MDEQNRASSEAIPQTDLGQILDGKPLSENSASQENHREQSDAASPGDNQREGSGPTRDNSWTFKAYEKERKTRQAVQARLREAEEERDALLHEQSQKLEASPEETQYWLNPHETVREVEIRTNSRASRAEFVSEYGKNTFEDLDRVVDEAMKKGHPDHNLLSDKMRKSSDPVAVMAHWASENLGWSPEAAQQNRSRPVVMPTNLANARNVGKRSGPAWSGPQSLQDIFNRNRS